VHTIAHEARHREHVTLYMKEYPQKFRTAFIKPPDPLCNSSLRLTVDTIEDFQYMNRLISQLPEGKQPIPLKEYMPIA